MEYVIRRKLKWEDFVVILFGILPLVDMLNGLYRSIPLGIVYKLFLCLVLLLNKIRRLGSLSGKMINIVIFVMAYTTFSIGINYLCLGGQIIDVDYPIKLMFNVVMMALLIDNCRSHTLKGESIYKILDIGAWMMIVCFLVPYFLGIGQVIYGGYGYKGYFIAQNELNLIIVVLMFFTSFKLIMKFGVLDLVRQALLLFCSILLNTKTVLVACLISIGIWGLSTLRKSKMIFKFATVFVIIVGILVFKDRFQTAVANSLTRQTVLQTQYYGNSLLAGILSGRNFFVEKAWNNLVQNNSEIRILIGNGFCSDILCEMDLFDIFFYLGIIGAIVTIFFLGWVMKCTIRESKYDGTLIRPISFITICMLLILSGHVLFMAMSGCFFILYCGFLIFYRPRANQLKQVVKHQSEIIGAYSDHISNNVAL